MAKRDDRKGAIRALVRGERIRTQKGLVELLQARGFDCTQATVSRDVSEMGLVKSREGYYALPEDLALRRVVAEMAVSVDDAENLVVLKTRSGSASMVAETLDNAGIDGLVGTIAGDNTIMIAAKSRTRAQTIATHLASMLRP